MLRRILCVDDDPNILAAFKREFRKQFQIQTADSGEAALQKLDQRRPYAVVVADMCMPGMNGLELLQRIETKAPDTVRVMLTGNSDQQTVVDAINEGHIVRFLTKPCPPEVRAKTLQAALKQYDLIAGEHELLEQTLNRTIQALVDVLALVNPAAFGRTTRLKGLMHDLAGAMGLPQMWTLESAALLSQIGAVLLPENVLRKVCSNASLTEEEQQIVAMQPSVAANLINKIPRMQEVARIIQFQDKNFDGSGFPRDNVTGEGIPIGARLLRVVLDFDARESSGERSADVLVAMQNDAYRYDPGVLSVLRQLINKGTSNQVCEVRADQLTGQMTLAEDAKSTTGMLLAGRGQRVSPVIQQFLLNFSRSGVLVEPLRVVINSNVDNPRRSSGYSMAN